MTGAGFGVSEAPGLLKVAIMSLAGSGTHRVDAVQEGPATPQTRILIVDDDEFVRDIMARKLRNQGYLCRTCGSSEQALRLLAETQYDLLLTDVNMPGMSGIDLVKRVQVSDPALAIILVTSFTLLKGHWSSQ